jgi:hypothetical protein
MYHTKSCKFVLRKDEIYNRLTKKCFHQIIYSFHETPLRFNGLFQALADWKINFVLKILTFSYEFVVSMDFFQVFMY